MLNASKVMDASAALLNDPLRRHFTYAIQMPYLNMAIAELRELCELYNIPITNQTQEDIVVPVNTTVIEFNAVAPAPSLPSDLIEPIELYERANGNDQSFIPMNKVDFLPSFSVVTSNLIYWSWQGQEIKLIGANIDTEVRIDYTRFVLPEAEDETDPIDMINAQSFLNYRTAALCAQFIGENESRAGVLNTNAGSALDRVIGIGIKGGQAIATRRRPFNQSWKVYNNQL